LLSKNLLPITNLLTDDEILNKKPAFYHEVPETTKGSSDFKFEPKFVTVFVESNIEFQIDISNPNLTCGWL